MYDLILSSNNSLTSYYVLQNIDLLRQNLSRKRSNFSRVFITLREKYMGL